MQSAPGNDYVPALSGKGLDKTVENAIVRLYQMVYGIKRAVIKIANRPVPKPDMNYIRHQLEAPGDYSLNLTGLIGLPGSVADLGVSGGYFVIVPTGSNATPDLKKGQTQQLTLTQNTTILPPKNAKTGVIWQIVIIQDSTGEWDVTWDTDYIDASRHPVFPLADRYSMFQYVVRPDGKSMLTSVPLVGGTF